MLADFVDPKLKVVRGEIYILRESGTNHPRLEDLIDLEAELAEFRTEIERIIKLPWKPNLNDGVIITASPLWKLFRLPKWQKDLKVCWEKLEKGDYDWAHLAYSIWPKRVEDACKRDRSIAIAHGLEHLCEVEPPKPKKSKATKRVSSGENADAMFAKEEPTSFQSSIKMTPKSVSTEETESRVKPISETDQTEVICAIRQVFNGGLSMDRESAMRNLTTSFSHQRLGSRTIEVLNNDLMIAVRRGILQNQNGQLSLLGKDLRDYDRGFLKDQFMASIGRSWIERDEAIRTFARWLGFSRIGPIIDETARSLINGLLREGRLEGEQEKIRRVAG